MANLIRLCREPIEPTAVLEFVGGPDSGAVLLFLGTVRELTDGRRTSSLDYEAYEEMAIAKLNDLALEARKRWALNRLAMVHRLGRLELGECSVAVAVSSGHREASFAAGRFLIDTLKKEVPIWKRENWADGTAEWIHPDADRPESQV